MQITHFSNSFIVVQSHGLKLCCDPWVGVANNGGWHSYPEYDKRDLIALLADTDLVFISHLHDDHFDPAFLVDSGLIAKTFVIKNFETKTLFNRLKRLGANVIELTAFDIFRHGAFKLAVIPQMTSNTSGLEDDVNYDLDTSIVVNDGDVTFFNQVDNPLSNADYATVSEFISREFGPLSVAALMCGAASEYPQAFINLDRDAEKKNTVAASLAKLNDKLSILKPACYFPAGGTYFIPGKLHALFKYLAQPDAGQISASLLDHHVSTRPLFLEGGETLTVTATRGAAEVYVERSTLLSPVSVSMSDSIASHRDDLYLHEMDTAVPSLEAIRSVFERARKNWLDVINRKSITISQNMSFVLYSDLLLDEHCQPRPDKKIDTLKMSEHDPYPLGELVVHIDVRAFVRCLTRKQVWNGTLGSLCLFERRPNVFHPSDTFSLNYLTTGDDALPTLDV